jgi:hypothetical protein
MLSASATSSVADVRPPELVSQLHSEENMAIRYRLFNRLDPGGAHFVSPTKRGTCMWENWKNFPLVGNDVVIAGILDILISDVYIFSQLLYLGMGIFAVFLCVYTTFAFSIFWYFSAREIYGIFRKFPFEKNKLQLMPTHVIPDSIFSILPFDDFKDGQGKQGSLVTIFSIWNTMVGTRLVLAPSALILLIVVLYI